jgi:hypothetical protein
MAFRIFVAAAILAAAAAIGYYLLRERFAPPPMPPASVPRAAPAPAAPPRPQYPIGADAKPLPKLGESDATLREALAALIDARTLDKLFDLQDGVRRIVATVDNLPRETLARRIDPVNPVGGTLATTGKEAALAIGPKNAARYAPFMRLVEAADTKKLVATYAHLYPLFQQAYVELGYPNGYFNDRLVEVIDHLLEAPEPKGVVKLTTPHVLYEFADPDLEAMSAGRKIMVRVGPENEAKLKAKLRELRREVVEQGKLGGQ